MQDPWGWCTGMARRGGVRGDVGGGVQGEERVCDRGGFVLMCGGTDAVLWGGWPPIEIKKFKFKKKATGNLAHYSMCQIRTLFFFFRTPYIYNSTSF